MAKVKTVIFISFLANQVIEMSAISSENGCVKPFCYCEERLNSNAVCSGRSLTYVPRFPSYVTSVVIKNTTLSTIGPLGLYNLTYHHIKQITLIDNLLKTIDRNAFHNLKYLNGLFISHEPLLDVHKLKKSLYSLQESQMETLSFTCNYWHVLPRNMFSGANVSKVRYLFLQGNHFYLVNFTTFQNMTNLVNLDLSNNQIERLSFTRMEKLKSMILNNNKILRIPNWCGHKTKIHFPSLKKLSLGNNNIGNIETNSFNCLPNLQKLHLENTNIGILQSNVFSELLKLRALYLNRLGNSLERIDDYAFNSSSLEELVMIEAKFPFHKNNRFNAETVFASCPNLKRLDLSGNRMPSDRATFQKMVKPLTKLQTLRLISSGLMFLPKNVFKNMPSLTELNLQDNSINSWNESSEIFGNKTSLTDLNLSHNFISVINETSFPTELLTSSKKIYLARNPFLCTCEQMWFRNWIEKNKHIIQEYPGGYKCRYPNNMNGVLLADYKPTKKTCNPWNPLYTMAIGLGFFVLMVIVTGGIIFKCQGNIKNYVYLLRVYRYRRRGYVTISNEDDFEYHAFVVYCDKDRAWVHGELLQKVEEEEGLKLCIHHRDFVVGENITSNVDNCMKKSWKVVVIMSNNFAESEWCQWEVDVVSERRRKQGPAVIVPIMLQNIDSKHMTSRVRALLDTTPHLKYRSGVGADLFWKTVIESLRKPLGHPPVALT